MPNLPHNISCNKSSNSSPSAPVDARTSSQGWPNQEGYDCAIVLAAGFSTRMGTCKAALPWHDGQTLLTYQLSQLMQAGLMPVVVLGRHNAQLQETCPTHVQVVVNPEATQGKTSSILTGLTAVPAPLRTVMISAVDQPRSATVYAQLLHAHHQSTASITVPVYGDRRGHPLLLSAKLLPQLHTLSEQTLGLRHMLQQYPDEIQSVMFRSAEVLLDLNTPESYRSQGFPSPTPV